MNSIEIICPPSGRTKARQVLFSRTLSPAALALVPVERERLDSACWLCGELSKRAISCAAFEVDWANELAPWDADAVFKGQPPFRGGAQRTLGFIEEALLPSLEKDEKIPLIIGGYSLAGLFALWCGFRSPVFDSVAAASPSIWYPGFIEYAKQAPFQARCAALSLGDREGAARHPLLRTVDECLKQTHALLSEQNVRARLDYNPGNHFVDADQRLVNCVAAAAGLLRT